MHNVLCQIVLNIFKYILLIKRTETFCSRDVIDIWAPFEFKTHKGFMCLIVLNIFKYIFWDYIHYVKMTLYSQRFLNYIK